MNALQTAALACVYLLAIAAALSLVVWLAWRGLNWLAEASGVGRVVLRYATDRQGRESARTAVEQDEEIARARRSDLARHDYLQGRLNAALLMLGRLMPEGYDASVLGGFDMLEADVRARAEELGLDPDIRQPMANFRENDYRLIEYAFGSYDEKYDREGSALPMNEIPRFRDMRFDDRGRMLATRR